MSVLYNLQIQETMIGLYHCQANSTQAGLLAMSTQTWIANRQAYRGRPSCAGLNLSKNQTKCLLSNSSLSNSTDSNDKPNVTITSNDVNQTSTDVTQTPTDINQTPTNVTQTTIDITQTPIDVTQMSTDITPTSIVATQTEEDTSPDDSIVTISTTPPLTISTLALCTSLGGAGLVIVFVAVCILVMVCYHKRLSRGKKPKSKGHGSRILRGNNHVLNFKATLALFS